MNGQQFAECKAMVGYVCATAIVIVMLFTDGDVATATAAACGMGLAGLGTYAVTKAKRTTSQG